MAKEDPNTLIVALVVQEKQDALKKIKSRIKKAEREMLKLENDIADLSTVKGLLSDFDMALKKVQNERDNAISELSKSEERVKKKVLEALKEQV